MMGKPFLFALSGAVSLACLTPMNGFALSASDDAASPPAMTSIPVKERSHTGSEYSKHIARHEGKSTSWAKHKASGKGLDESLVAGRSAFTPCPTSEKFDFLRTIPLLEENASLPLKSSGSTVKTDTPKVSFEKISSEKLSQVPLPLIGGASSLTQTDAGGGDEPLTEGTHASTTFSSTALPTTFLSADEILSLLEKNDDLLVHMEALRRGYRDLSDSEKNNLLLGLHRRYFIAEDDPLRFFDQGYAQLLFNHNKSGLFFLRKANDRLKTPLSSLAYAMAQAEVDLEVEGAKPDEYTTRKMDVGYKLEDAASLAASSPQAGFWPAFTRVIERLNTFPAYSDCIRSLKTSHPSFPSAKLQTGV